MFHLFIHRDWKWNFKFKSEFLFLLFAEIEEPIFDVIRFSRNWFLYLFAESRRVFKIFTTYLAKCKSLFFLLVAANGFAYPQLAAFAANWRVCIVGCSFHFYLPFSEIEELIFIINRFRQIEIPYLSCLSADRFAKIENVNSNLSANILFTYLPKLKTYFPV